MKRILILFLLMGFLTVTNAFAFRCGGEIVSKGESVATLMARCGRPDYKEYASEKHNNRWKSVQRWYYNCGSNDFIYKLTVIDSIVVAEDIIGRGSGKPGWQK